MTTLHGADDRTPSGLRAAAYLRVSTDEQAAEGFSIAEQEHRALARVEAKGWSHVETFSDPGVSGSVPMRDRPGGGEMVRRLADFDAIVTASLDRLGRSQRDLAEQFELYEREGVAVVSLREDLDGTTATGRVVRGILSAFAEFERDVGRERTSAGIASRARAGLPWGAPAYGYQKREGGGWEPEPGEAAVAQRIFRERVEHGRSYSAISRRLNFDAVPTRRGGEWTATVVRRILTSRAVRGEFHHGGEWLEGRHPAIVDEETWQAAQAMAEQGRKYAPRGAGRLPTRHMFVRGMLRCGYCGGAMLPRSGEGEDVYVCRTHKQTMGADGCPMLPIKRVAVDVPALRLFERVGLDVAGTRERVAEQLDARIAEVSAQAARADREAAEKAAQAERIEGHFVSGELGVANYERLSARLAEELAAAEAERDQLAARREQLRATDLDAESETLRRLAELRAQVAGKVEAARGRADASGDVGALRAAIAAMFEAVHLRPADDHRWTEEPGAAEHADEFGERIERHWIVPELREELLEDYRRVPLGLDADNSTGSGVPE